MSKVSRATRINRVEGDPRWREGDSEFLAATGPGSMITMGQVNIFLDCIAGGDYRYREALEAAGLSGDTWRQIVKTFPEVAARYGSAKGWSAERYEEQSVAVLADAVGWDEAEATFKNAEPHLLKYYSDALYRRASVRDRRQFGEKSQVEASVNVGVVVIPAESWGQIVTGEPGWLPPPTGHPALGPGEESP